MTRLLAFVSTLISYLSTCLTTSIFHEILHAYNAFTLGMASFLTLMSTLKVALANLATTELLFMTEDFVLSLTTVARRCYYDKARWTLAIVTL